MHQDRKFMNKTSLEFSTNDINKLNQDESLQLQQQQTSIFNLPEAGKLKTHPRNTATSGFAQISEQSRELKSTLPSVRLSQSWNRQPKEHD